MNEKSRFDIVDMKSAGSENSIIEINRDSLEEATGVLFRAFEDDPLVRYFLSGHGDKYPDKVRELFRYQCFMYIEMGLPVIGTVRNSNITGVACLSVPENKERPDSLVKADKEFNESVGPDMLERVTGFMSLSRKYRPGGKFHYLAALGVDPDYQGQGFGRLLLDEVHKISGSHGESIGVYLDTAKIKNVEMYEHFGYKRLAEDKLDDVVDLWFIFRPVDKND